MLMHGILPSSMLSVVLAPVVKDKTGKISSMDNYRPTALASVISKVFEIVLLDRFQKYVVTLPLMSSLVLKVNMELICASMP